MNDVNPKGDWLERLLRVCKKIGLEAIIKALAVAFVSWLIAAVYRSGRDILANIPIYIFFAVAGAVLCAIVIYLFRSLYGRHDPLIEDYERDDVGSLIAVQCGLRVILVMLALWATIRAASLSPETSVVLEIHRAQMIIVALYFCTVIYFLREGLKKNKAALKDPSKAPTGILWLPAIVDSIFITFMAASTVGEDLYHFGYLIPAMGAWLFSQTYRGRRLFYTIWAGVVLDYAVIWAVVRYSPGFIQGLSLQTLPMFLMTTLLPKALFWGAAIVPFVFLKKVRIVELRKRDLINHMLENMPYYVILKNREGHVKWANARFFKNDVMHTEDQVYSAHGGKGMTDRDLYGEELAQKYKRHDDDVMDQARQCLLEGKTAAGVRYSSPELHYFARRNAWRWVQVTKTPWLDGVNNNTEVIGIQVYFHDSHETFCRQGMIHRWIFTHMPHSLQVLNAKKVYGPSLSRFMDLQLTVVQWIKTIIGDDKIKPEHKTFELGSLRWLEPILRQRYENIKLEFVWPVHAVAIDGDIRILEVILLLFVMNACEACGALASPAGPSPMVRAELAVGDDRISIIVEDCGGGFDKKKETWIDRGPILNSKGEPGSGLYLVTHLASVLEGTRTVSSSGRVRGTAAVFTCRKDRFETKCSKPLLELPSDARVEAADI